MLTLTYQIYTFYFQAFKLLAWKKWTEIIFNDGVIAYFKVPG